MRKFKFIVGTEKPVKTIYEQDDLFNYNVQAQELDKYGRQVLKEHLEDIGYKEPQDFQKKLKETSFLFYYECDPKEKRYNL